MGNANSSITSAPLREDNLPDQTGKVFMVTGATSGIGLELTKILYSSNATVWMAVRSRTKAEEASNSIKQGNPTSRGKLEILEIDFDDLTTVKPAAAEFIRRESRLDVLWNNAGVMIPPRGTTTKQGYEAQLGVNTLAPFLFTKLLTETLIRNAEASPAGNTRVVWISSSAAGRFSPDGGVDMAKLSGSSNVDYSQWQLYGISKAGNILHSYEFARKYGSQGVVSVAVDPGVIETPLYKNMPKWQLFFARTVLKPVAFGAFTELFAGLSPDVTNGSWVIPWGKLSTPREDIELAGRVEGAGGTGVATKFWEWCEKEVAAYA